MIPVAIAVALVAITALTFAPVRHFPFVALDDPTMVSENPYVLGGLTWAGVKWAFQIYFHFWIPATSISYMADVQLHGPNPGWMHVTNVALHVISTLLLFAILARTTGAAWRSAVVAALFAVHPLHVESVAWIAERKDVLSTVGWWLTTAAYVWYARKPHWGRYALVVVAFVFGLSAKPMLVTLPATLLLLDLWPLGRLTFDAPGRARWWPLVREKLPLGVLSVIGSVVAYVAQGDALGSVGVVPIPVRLANAVTSYATYIVKMCWPVDLAVLYPLSTTFSPWWLATDVVVLAAVTVAAVRAARRHPYLTVGWFWYLGTLVPVIGLVQVGIFARADRFTYVPLTGLFIMIAWGVPEALRSWPAARRLIPVATAAVLLALALQTRQQIGYWRDTVTLWQHTAHVVLGQDDATAQQTVVTMLMSQKRFGEVAEHLAAAAPSPSAKPRDAAAIGDVGLDLVKAGRVDEGMEKYREALAIDPSLAPLHNNLGAALATRGRVAEALAEFQEAVRLRPDFAEAQDNAGVALAQLNRVPEAAPYFEAAIRLRPDNELAHLHYGMALARLGRFAEARREFLDVLRINPANQKARQALAKIK